MLGCASPLSPTSFVVSQSKASRRVFNLNESPYLLDDNATSEVLARLKTIEERVFLLRKEGTLTPDTVRHLLWGEAVRAGDRI